MPARDQVAAPAAAARAPRQQGELAGAVGEDHRKTGQFRAGQQVGAWTTYDRDGAAVKVTHF